MYITINGKRYSCTRREADADEVRYYGVEPLPESVSGIVRTCTEAGFVLAEDHAEAYARQEIGTTRVTLTNKPEPQPEPEPTPAVDERVAKLESENKLLKEQVSAQADQAEFYEDCIAEMAAIVYA